MYEQKIEKSPLETTHKFTFTGNATAFFKIWIVNMLLSIITLGIYSPWAKVRNNQYIYGHLNLNGFSFEYTANPIKILIGRLIVVGVYGVYFVLMDIFGFYEFAIAIICVFTLSVPYLIRQAVRFRARYTRYRGVNFHHFATTRQYYKYFLLQLILIILTFGIIFPYSVKKFKDLVINHTSYGDKNFIFTSTASKFYEAYLKALGLSFIPIVIFGVVMSFVAKDLVDSLGDINSTVDVENMSAIGSFMIILGLFYVVILLFGPFIKGVLSGWVGNVIYNSTTINKLTFKSDWHIWKLGWISLSNAIVIILTLGLMYPWAKIRVIKHKANHTYMEGLGFDDFANQAQQDTRALGEEAADFFDVDVGL